MEKITASSVSNHGSTSYTRFKISSFTSSSKFTAAHWNYPGGTKYTFSQYSLYIKACGGSYHGANRYRMRAKSSSSIDYYNYANSNLSTISDKSRHSWDVAGVAGSTTSSVSQGTQRIYNTGTNASCVNAYKYTYGNATYPINYRLYIRVKM